MIRRDRIAARLAVGIGALSVAATLILGGGAFLVDRKLRTVDDRPSAGLLDGNRRVAASRLDALRGTLERTDARLEELETIEWRARLINGLGPAPRPLVGTGFDDPAAAPGTFVFASATPAHIPAALSRLYVMDETLAARSEIRDVTLKARRMRSSFEEILAAMESERDFWERIPSIVPLEQGDLSSHFGYRLDPFTGRLAWHDGLDITATTGTPILATASGIVSRAGWFGGYGNTVEIDHGNGLHTLYAHTSLVAVNPGDPVERGQVVAYVGRTGRASAPHLHYEVRLHGVPVNPGPYIFSEFITAD